MNTYAQIKENIGALRAELARFPGARLLAATKHVSAEAINYAVRECGLDLIGENRVQELTEKYDQIEKDGVQIHFIGTLQTNKVKNIVDKVDMIHSLSGMRLAHEIEKRCAAIDKVMDVLIEINIAREPSKDGVMPEQVFDFYDSIKDLSHLRCVGLMTMAPADAGEQGWRSYFSQAKEIFDTFVRDCIPDVEDPVLSMGMSASYGVALECGSSMIRVGSQIFDARKY